MGYDAWDQAVFTVTVGRTGSTRAVNVFANANGGSVGDGHGRFHPTAAAGDFLTGDVLYGYFH